MSHAYNYPEDHLQNLVISLPYSCYYPLIFCPQWKDTRFRYDKIKDQAEKQRYAQTDRYDSVEIAGVFAALKENRDEIFEMLLQHGPIPLRPVLSGAVPVQGNSWFAQAQAVRLSGRERYSLAFPTAGLIGERFCSPLVSCLARGRTQ